MPQSTRTTCSSGRHWAAWILLLGLFSACGRAPATTPAPVTNTPAQAAAISPQPATPPTDTTPAGVVGTASPQSIYFPWFTHADLPTPTSPPPAPPANTSPPRPVWPEPLGHPTASKLSVHTLNNSEPYVMEFVRRAQPRLIKAVGDIGWLQEVKQVSPQTVTIGRLLPEQSEWILTVDPTIAGVAYVDLNMDSYRLNPFVDYWEGWNEFVPENVERMRWFAQFEATRACTMQARGFKAAVGGFSVGVPEYTLMAEFIPALEAAKRCGAIFHLHEYASPTFDCLTAVNVPNIIPGAPALPVTAGPLGLRYRFWYEGYLKPRGLGDIPLVISELGIDGVKPSPACDDPGGTGWTGYTKWWEQHGLGADGPQAYVNVLQWYDAELRRDPYVLGATLFTTGAVDNNSSWHPFDLHDVLIPLTKYAVSQP